MVKNVYSLLRYGHLLGIDKPYLEAGNLMKELNQTAHGFLFLNRYLDIYEMIEDHDNQIMDENDELKKTDFPSLSKLTLPESNLIN